MTRQAQGRPTPSPYSARGGGRTRASLPLAPFARGDSDADVDLADYAHLAACMNYPGGAIAEGCACEDFDGDGDVDLVDLAGFQRAFNP